MNDTESERAEVNDQVTQLAEQLLQLDELTFEMIGMLIEALAHDHDGSLTAKMEAVISQMRANPMTLAQKREALFELLQQ